MGDTVTCPDCGYDVSIPTRVGPWNVGILNVLLHLRDKHPDRYAELLAKAKAAAPTTRRDVVG